MRFPIGTMPTVHLPRYKLTTQQAVDDEEGKRMRTVNIRSQRVDDPRPWSRAKKGKK